MEIRSKISKTAETLIKIAGVVAALSAVAGAYVFYINYIWKPKIAITSIDYTTGVAVLKINGKDITIYGSDTFFINGDWGIRFGVTYEGNDSIYDRLELIRHSMVYEYIQPKK